MCTRNNARKTVNVHAKGSESYMHEKGGIHDGNTHLKRPTAFPDGSPTPTNHKFVFRHVGMLPRPLLDVNA